MARERDSDRLTLDQEIEGSNPSSPATPQDVVVAGPADRYLLSLLPSTLAFCGLYTHLPKIRRPYFVLG